MKTNDMLMYGGLAAAAYLILGKKTTTTTTTTTTPTGTVTTPVGTPTQPATYDQNYYLQYVYPAMVKANPNIINPNYQLTHTENAQYGANYLDMQQWVAQPINNNHGTVVPDQYPDTWAAVQWHWTNIGVPQKRTFMKLWAMDTTPYSGGPINTNSSGGGSGWFSTALGIATSIIGLLGVDDKLTNEDIDILVTSGAIIKDILPMYAGVEPELVGKMDGRLSSLIQQYTQWP